MSEQPLRARNFPGTAGQSGIAIPVFPAGVTTFTFSMRVKSVQATAFKYLYDQDTTRLTLGWGGGATGQIGFNDGTWKNFGASPNDNQWHDLDWVFTPTTATLYVDNVQLGTTLAYTGIALASSNAIEIGRNRLGTGGEFIGRMHNFRVFNIALSADQRTWVHTHGQSGTPVPLANTLRWYNFEGTHPTIAYDKTGLDKHGTIGSAVTVDAAADTPYSDVNINGYGEAWESTGANPAPHIAIPGAHLPGKVAANVEFNLRTVDDIAVLFGSGPLIAFLGVIEDGNASTVQHTRSGSPTISVAGTPFSGTRDQLHTQVADNVVHAMAISNWDLTNADWTSNGVRVGGYNSATYEFTGWVNRLTLDGVEYPGYIIPRVAEGDLDVLDNELYYNPIVATLHNRRSHQQLLVPR